MAAYGPQAVQTAIRALGTQPIAIDGIIGNQTIAAYSKLSGDAKGIVDNLARSLDVDINRKIVSKADLSRIAENVSARYNVPLSYLMNTVDIENIPVADGYLIETAGKYRGLGQFDRVTWNAVTSEPFNRAGDVASDLRAIAQLYLANKQTFRNEFGPREFTDRIAYLYHNQGAGAAAQYLRTGKLRFSKQSDVALAVFRDAKGEHDATNQNSTIA